MGVHIALYHKLLALPLFTGMSQAELADVVAHTKFNFKTIQPDTGIVAEGDKSGSLVMLTNGRTAIRTKADDGGYDVTEETQAPAVIQPERLFGLGQRYTQNWTALTVCSLISVDKSEVLRLTSESLIFRLNLLNAISTQLQRKQREAWHSLPRSLDERLCRFFLAHCLHPAGEKTFHIKMTRLAKEVNDNRDHISMALHRLQDKGLVKLSRGQIVVHAIEKMRNT